MGFAAKVLCDSRHCRTGVRLTTMELTYPRFVHSEHLRHRKQSFNVASSRAIPVMKMLSQVCDDPVLPIHYGAAQKGMQADNQVSLEASEKARAIILHLRDQAVSAAEQLLDLGLHKQVVNRYLEPWMWATVICTTDGKGWAHFDSLRCHPDAEPHIRHIAEMASVVRMQSVPKLLQIGEWHLPLFGFDGDGEITDVMDSVRISAGRCARVSYLTHAGIRDICEDMGLCDDLIEKRHFSPTEHQAMCAESSECKPSNFDGGWLQYRKTLAGEYMPQDLA